MHSEILYSLGLSRFGGCMPGLSIIMWQRIALLIGPNKRRNSVSISCVKQDVDGCKGETERCPASSRSSSSVTLLVSSHFSSSFFTIRLFSELSVMLFKLSSFYHSTHQRSPSSSSLHLSLIPLLLHFQASNLPCTSLSQFHLLFPREPTRQNENSCGLFLEHNCTKCRETLTCASE